MTHFSTRLAWADSRIRYDVDAISHHGQVVIAIDLEAARLEAVIDGR